MKKMILVASLAMLWPAANAWAQLNPTNEAGVTMGHVQVNVKDMEASKKFWELLGGTPLKIDGMEAIKFPGVFVFLKAGTPPDGPPPSRIQVLCGCPSDGFEPSVLNHLGFLLRNYDDAIAKYTAAGLTMKGIPGTGRKQTLLFSPDNVALEMAEGKLLSVPITQMHFHFFAPAFIADYPHRVPAFAMYLWYAETFGAVLEKEALGAQLPGVNMRFSSSPLPTTPTKGRAVDHIGFEVTNLEEFCRGLEAKGIKLDKPYSKTGHPSFASAELTDPWGTSIELTEGLSKF